MAELLKGAPLSRHRYLRPTEGGGVKIGEQSDVHRNPLGI
jgi:hypothetical protein